VRATGVAALIAAAGSGSRLGQGPKAFLTVRGTSLLELSLRAFEGAVSEVVVALPAAAVSDFRESHPEITVVAGGATRQSSVAAMLAATRSDVVLIHDVARPFLTRAVIDRVATAARTFGAATAVLEVTDTVIDVEAGATLERAHLRLVQTPQGFDKALLLEAHAAASRSGATVTDDTELVRRTGHRVELVQGSRLLHKLTAPDDLTLAELLYDQWVRERRTEVGHG
jgi:2-C-methyl-D-erythritol 4-phosphate cytidylyltransferase